MWDWVKGKLTREAGKEAVADLEKTPADAINAQALVAQLAKLLRDDPAARAELAALLAQAPTGNVHQTAYVTGDENKFVQQSGSGTVSIK